MLSGVADSSSDFAWQLLFAIVQFNVILGLFNLLPVPPLDGYNLVLPFLPANVAYQVQRYAQYGVIVLLLLVLLPRLVPAESIRWAGSSRRPTPSPLLLTGVWGLDAVHRVEQFLGHVRASVTPAETATARRLLPACGLAIVRRHAGRRSPPRTGRGGAPDRRRRRRSRTCWPPRCCTMRPRAIACASGIGWPGVLLEALAQPSCERLASPDPRSWRYPFHLYLHHAELSADAAGASRLLPRARWPSSEGTATGADASLAAAFASADEAS